MLNKVSGVTPARLAAIRAGDPAFELAKFMVLGTGLFDFDRAHQHPRWLQELNGFRDHVPKTEEYGVGSFVYRARRPFHPQRFEAFLRLTWLGLIRAKGLFWLATRTAHVGELSLAGAVMRTGAMAYWWAAVPKDRWPDHSDWTKRMRARWAVSWGDRRQELVFIGRALDQAAIRAALDARLNESSDAMAFDPADYGALPDPFPRWDSARAA